MVIQPTTKTLDGTDKYHSEIKNARNKQLTFSNTSYKQSNRVTNQN